jgi:hypothetical protein
MTFSPCATNAGLEDIVALTMSYCIVQAAESLMDVELDLRKKDRKRPLERMQTPDAAIGQEGSIENEGG